ncbi:thiopurine S-methyltransferase [Arcobacter roscoffensis]|uniref:Thiopurine S-methyltransferase n=1 Tax=Arcobacter roscoffensis TaxID=2961520 RepID=A0ABY5E320_9BACT|nr:thiopurine S-methyltransferase [Arcobacter roscoffensis]UTJ06571.1 thiopurine S-methyltransferase [Arcobacter roscoffensis]
MDLDFWNERWEKEEIAFHMKKVNPMLIKYFHKLNLAQKKRIFLPLCGKTLDIAWLLSKGYSIVGIELNKDAIDALFHELNITPLISKENDFVKYSAKNIDIYVGDFFKMSAEILKPIDAIYDRAALVALPLEMRIEYVSHLLNITNVAPQLLISYDYEQNIMSGPPFSVPLSEIEHHYSDYYEIKLLDENIDIPSGLKRKSQAIETVCILHNS